MSDHLIPEPAPVRTSVHAGFTLPRSLIPWADALTAAKSKKSKKSDPTIIDR